MVVTEGERAAVWSWCREHMGDDNARTLMELLRSDPREPGLPEARVESLVRLRVAESSTELVKHLFWWFLALEWMVIVFALAAAD